MLLQMSVTMTLFFLSGPNGTPFHPHVSMENKLEELEEQHKKGKRKNLPTEKIPKRTYRSPGNVSELVDAHLRRRDLLPGAHQDA